MVWAVSTGLLTTMLLIPRHKFPVPWFAFLFTAFPSVWLVLAMLVWTAKFPVTECPGISSFYKDASNNVFHTYSSFGRGLEITLTCDEAAFQGSGAFLLGAVLDVLGHAVRLLVDNADAHPGP